MGVTYIKGRRLKNRGPGVSFEPSSTDEPLNSISSPVLVFKLPCWDLPGGPVVKTLSSNAWGVGLIPGRGAKIPIYLMAKKPKHKTEAIL